MCHHWADDRDAGWEKLSEDLPEEDPELEEPDREHDERVETPAADD